MKEKETEKFDLSDISLIELKTNDGIYHESAEILWVYVTRNQTLFS